MLNKSNCVVYLIRADHRDFRIDLECFKALFEMENENEKSKVILALNYADKIEPV